MTTKNATAPSAGAELQKVEAALDARRRLHAEKLQFRKTLLSRILLATPSTQDDVELATVNAEIASLGGTIEALESRQAELRQQVETERRMAIRRETEVARRKIAERAAGQVEQARAVEQAGKALLQALTAYRETSEQLTADARELLQRIGLTARHDVLARIVGALSARHSVEPGVLLIREIVRASPCAVLAGHIITNNTVQDGGPGFIETAERAAAEVQRVLVDELVMEEDADA